MKRILIALVALLAMTMAADARTFVLIAGVSNYDDPQNNLSQTTKDAKRFKEVMQSQTRDITTLTSRYATAENIKEKLRAIANRAGASDDIVFFFSGHGMPGAMYTYSGPLYYTDLVSILERSQARSKVCYIDVCHAGSVADAATSGGGHPQNQAGMAFFVSSRPEEVSRENTAIGAGYFTQALVKGLRGSADKDHNRQVTVKELFNYLYKDVVRRSSNEQHPQLIAPRSMYDVVVANWEQ